MYKMYAIPNCDTVKKARAVLEKKKIAYEFIDFKKAPPTKELISLWAEFFGELPVNTKGPTFRKVKDEYETKSSSEKIKMMIEFSSMIKRPVLEKNGKVVCIGFDEEYYSKLK